MALVYSFPEGKLLENSESPSQVEQTPIVESYQPEDLLEIAKLSEVINVIYTNVANIPKDKLAAAIKKYIEDELGGKK